MFRWHSANGPSTTYQTVPHHSNRNHYNCSCCDKTSNSVKWKQGNPYQTFYNNFTTENVPLTPRLDTSRNLVSQQSGRNVRFIESSETSRNMLGGKSYTGEVYTTGAASIYRAQEKEELQRLNQRFTEYIMKVRNLSQQSKTLDATAFMQTTKILEEECTKLKALYERELENMRMQLEGAGKENTNFQQLCIRYQQSAKDLEERCLLETDKNRKCIDQINSLQQQITGLEQELVRGRMTTMPKEDIPRLKRDLENLSRENESLKSRLEKEQALRREIEEKFLALQKKMDFDKKVQDEQQADLRQRLEASTAAVFAMESKMKQIGKTDTNIPDLLNQVRSAAETEFRKYQSESDQQHSKNMHALKSQMESGNRAMEQLELEKAGALSGVGDLKARIASLESQVNAGEQQKRALEALLQQERANFAAQLRGVEKRFQDFQTTLMAKFQEINMSRESYIPLKAEIEALKCLLTDEEKRLSASTASYKQSASYSMSSSSSPAVTNTYISQPGTTAYRATSYNYTSAPDVTKSSDGYRTTGYNYTSAPDVTKSSGGYRTTRYGYQTTPDVTKSMTQYCYGPRTVKMRTTSGW